MLLEGWIRLGVVALAMVAGILFVLRPRRSGSRTRTGKSDVVQTEYSQVDQYLGSNGGGHHHTHHSSIGHGHGSD